MPRLVGFIVFFLIAVGIVAGVHGYLWLRLVRDTALPPPWYRIGTWSVWILAMSLPLGLLVGRFLQASWAKPFLWASYIWMGAMFLLLVLVAGIDLVRIFFTGTSRLAGLAGPPVDPERRIALMRLLGGGAATFGAISTVAGIYEARRTPRVVNVDVPLSRLPAELHGMTIVQLSDVHIGPTLGAGWLTKVVERVNELNPDVVAITGDLVDGSVEELRDGVAPLALLRAKHGVFFVTGNHEYYSGADAWIAELGRLGVRVLRNEHVTIGSGAKGLVLAGVDDPTAHQFGGNHGEDLVRALQGVDPSQEVVLLAHQPKSIYAAAEQGVGLQLSGHTHGGQIWPFGYLVRLTQPYLAGFAKHGPTYIYVSRGTGYWGPPIRLGAPPEITRVTLASTQP